MSNIYNIKIQNIQIFKFRDGIRETENPIVAYKGCIQQYKKNLYVKTRQKSIWLIVVIYCL